MKEFIGIVSLLHDLGKDFRVEHCAHLTAITIYPYASIRIHKIKPEYTVKIGRVDTPNGLPPWAWASDAYTYTDINTATDVFLGLIKGES
jgi:hypothetical protein